MRARRAVAMRAPYTPDRPPRRLTLAHSSGWLHGGGVGPGTGEGAGMRVADAQAGAEAGEEAPHGVGVVLHIH